MHKNTNIHIQDKFVCYICLDHKQNNINKILLPCNCNTHVHKNCLIKWILSSHNTKPFTCVRGYYLI